MVLFHDYLNGYELRYQNVNQILQKTYWIVCVLIDYSDLLI